jgi:putative ABC transport system permease protein
MIFRNLQFTLRNLRNQKLFTFVNLFGLTTGIIAASLILIYINYELNFDRYHKNANRIVRVYSSFTNEGVDGAWVQIPAPLASFLQYKFPEIVKTVRISRLPKGLVSSGDKNFYEERILIADSTILDVFTLPLIIGNKNLVLAQPNSVILTESEAAKYFGKNDPIGKIIHYNRTIDLIVTGIMKNIPGNSHLQFDMVIPMSGANKFFGDDFLTDRVNTVTALYLLTNPETDYERLDKSISNSTKEYNGGIDFGDNQAYHIQPLTSIHLHSDMGGEFAQNSDIKSIYILCTIAFLILIVACINYINLSFSVNNRRSTEMGMRRIMGASRKQLLFLYLSDSSVTVGISVILSAFIISDPPVWFRSLMGITISDNYSITNLIPALVLLFLTITVLTGLISGWISSNISPMDTLKKPSLKSDKLIGTQGILVLFQFGISITLIISTLFVYRQMKFVQNLNLGFSKDQLMIIPINDNEIRLKIESFKQELTKNPSVLSAGATSDLPGQMLWVNTIHFEGQSEQAPATMTFLEIDKDFINTYGVQLKKGYLPGDTACPYSGTEYLLNESAVKKLGWSDPIGKWFYSPNGKDGFVTGIVKDFHFKSLHNELEPLFLYIRDSTSYYLAVKLNTAGISGSVDYIQKLWNKMVPDSPFEYFFYDNFYDQLYKKETLFGKIIFIFSTIAILIACMGLFGLAAFFSEKRTKEIGIRKVNGAEITEVIRMLNKEFIKWVIIAFVIATPIAWYAMHIWVQSFAYKAELSWWIFGLAGVIALGISLLTVSWQSWKAATRNPVEALRYE